jgi:Tfp pilus assembly protein FimT
MVADDGELRATRARETREDAARAIATALRFLRDEARSLGMYEVHVAIELARATASSYCRQSSKKGRG